MIELYSATEMCQGLNKIIAKTLKRRTENSSKDL